MPTKLGHLVFGIDDKNRGFYRDLLSFLSWQILYDVEGMIAAGDSNGVSLWFGSSTKDVANDYMVIEKRPIDVTKNVTKSMIALSR